MRVIKLALISAVIFFLIATAFSLMIPSHVRISKAINMRADRLVVLNTIADSQTWRHWHPAFMPEDSARIPRIHIIGRQLTDSSVVMQLQQGNRRPLTNGWNLYEGSDSLTVQWYMDFHLSWYPWQKFGSLFFENTYGNMMQKGLENLKARVEGQ